MSHGPSWTEGDPQMCFQALVAARGGGHCFLSGWEPAQDSRQTNGLIAGLAAAGHRAHHLPTET